MSTATKTAVDQGEQAGYISVDLSQMPDILRDELLKAMTAPMTAFFAQPENQAKYEKWLKARAEKDEGRRKHNG